jgi:cell division protein FtsB
VTLAAFIVFVVAVLVIAGLHAWSLHQMLDRQRRRDVEDEGRQQALQKQHKSAMHDVVALERRIGEFAEKSRALHDDARLMHARVDGFFSHPEVRRMLDAGASGRGG